jgi:putative spermidine/putrescine transport system permease protein
MSRQALAYLVRHTMIVILCMALLAPILIVLIVSFSGDGYLKFPPTSISLRWYDRFLGDARWRDALVTSFVVALIASSIATLTGFLAAYGFVRGGLGAKRAILSFVLMPMIVPHVITAIALYFLSAKLKLIGSLVWMGVAHAVIGLPIVVLILISALQGVDIDLERAALNLGASLTQLYWRVVVPIAIPGVVSAALFAFLASFDELVIALFLSGVKAQTLPVRIWNSLLLEVEPTIAAVSSFLIAITILALIIDWTMRRNREGPAGSRS